MALKREEPKRGNTDKRTPTRKKRKLKPLESKSKR